MISKQDITAAAEAHLAGTELFLVDVSVSADNCVAVEIDTHAVGVSIDDCAALSRAIEQAVPRDNEDYELQVGSAGLTSPFKVVEQYRKNVGNPVETLTAQGQKLRGTLSAAGDDTFTVTVQKRVRPEGAKRPVLQDEDITLRYSETKYTKYLIQFK